MDVASVRIAATSPIGVSVLSGIVGAIVAVATGREKTRIDNFIIGGLFTGFAAYRDPRSSLGLTLLVASIEGAVWGITDRTTPLIKEALLPTDTNSETANA
jgi:hypothetical protein